MPDRTDDPEMKKERYKWARKITLSYSKWKPHMKGLPIAG